VSSTTKSHGIIVFAVAAVVAVAIFLSLNQSKQQSTDRRSNMALDTFVSVSLPMQGSQKERDELFNMIMAELIGAEAILNVYDPESEVSRTSLRLSVGEPCDISQPFAAYTTQYMGLTRVSNGCLDLFMDDLIRLWDWRGADPKVPDGSQIQKLLQARQGEMGLVLQRGDSERNLPPRIMFSEPHADRKLHFGAVLKGLAIDQAIGELRARGVEMALINAGGDLYALGGHPEGGSWRVGIQHPRKADGKLLCSVEVRDCAIATSGDYQQFFFDEGIRYHHILDPRTGRPSRNCIAASVMAPTTAAADALATAAMVEGKGFLTRLEETTRALNWPAGNLQVIMVLPDGSVEYSSGWKFIEPPPAKILLSEGKSSP
jgi:FAD:protein FMN transferase